MRVQRSALLCLATVASLTFVAADAAFAQKSSGRGPSLNVGSSQPRGQLTNIGTGKPRGPMPNIATGKPRGPTPNIATSQPSGGGNYPRGGYQSGGYRGGWGAAGEGVEFGENERRMKEQG